MEDAFRSRFDLAAQDSLIGVIRPYPLEKRDRIGVVVNYLTVKDGYISADELLYQRRVQALIGRRFAQHRLPVVVHRKRPHRLNYDLSNDILDHALRLARQRLNAAIYVIGQVDDDSGGHRP